MGKVDDPVGKTTVEWFSYKNDPHISKLIVMVPKERMDG
jgi:hypothetical protein